jgi:hypothetical protein
LKAATNAFKNYSIRLKINEPKQAEKITLLPRLTFGSPERQ